MKKYAGWACEFFTFIDPSKKSWLKRYIKYIDSSKPSTVLLGLKIMLSSLNLDALAIWFQETKNSHQYSLSVNGSEVELFNLTLSKNSLSLKKEKEEFHLKSNPEQDAWRILSNIIKNVA